MLLNSRELLKRFVHIGTSWCPNIDMSSYRLNLTTKACHILYFFSLWRVHACTTPDECLHELSVSVNRVLVSLFELTWVETSLDNNTVQISPGLFCHSLLDPSLHIPYFRGNFVLPGNDQPCSKFVKRFVFI